MSKYSTSYSLASGSSLRESSFFWTISINITSSSSPLVQTSSVLDDLGTNPSDSKNELSLRTFSVMNETDRSGGVEGLTWIFSGLSFFSSSFSYVLSSWESLCCLGWSVTALIEPWTWVEHCGSLVSPKLFFSGLKVYHLPLASLVALEQDELPSSVGLDFRARLDGGRMARSSNNAQDSLAFQSRSLPPADWSMSFSVERIEQGNE
ncbi:hypothetical protein Tco_0614673 [Tanacetum coccineum]